MAWAKGASGNPGGRTNEKLFADTLRLVVKEDDPVSKQRKLRRVVEKLVDCAMNGESWAIQQVADRLDGKPAQESTVTIQRAVAELTDAEIAARIAELRGTEPSGGVPEPTPHSSQLN